MTAFFLLQGVGMVAERYCAAGLGKRRLPRALKIVLTMLYLLATSWLFWAPLHYRGVHKKAVVSALGLLQGWVPIVTV